MKSLKRKCFAPMILMMVVLLTSCSLTAVKAPESGINNPDDRDNTICPLVVTDFVGREVSIETPPKRIVSLAPGITEILFELGLGDNVVGVTGFDDYPQEVSRVAKVGDFNGPNLEAIAAQRPDIILASSLSGQNGMEALQRLGIPVLMLEARDIEQIYSSIQIIGEITGKPDEGSALIADMQARMDVIAERVSGRPKPRVYYIVDLNGNFTSGKGTFIDQLITLAGGINVAGDGDGWVQYSMEKLVEKNPEVIITAAHAGDMDSLGKLTGYRETDAVKNNRVFVISDDNIISRTSYRIVLGLEEIAKFLHPGAF
jgi:iron complex transport system substrate-binding protein